MQVTGDAVEVSQGGKIVNGPPLYRLVGNLLSRPRPRVSVTTN